MTLLVAAVSLVSFCLHIALMALWTRSIAEDVAAAIGGRVGQAHRALVQAPPGERAATAAALSRDRLVVQRLPARDTTAARPTPPLASVLLDELRSSLAPDIEVRLPHPDEAEQRGLIHFDFMLDGQPWRMTFALQPPVTALLGTSLGWLALVALAVFASLVLGVRFIARPIGRLAERLQAQGNRIEPLPEQPHSATELQQLTSAFNRLALAVRQADNDRQHMLAGVSHDLRTPLARLKLRIETQLDERGATPLLADVDALERIVSQFLAFVQGEGGAGLGEHDDAGAVLQQVVGGYQAQGRHVTLRLHDGAPTELPDLALQRLTTNLIDNALAHGTAPVVVTLCREGAHTVLAVSDAGAGMDAATFAQAQQPFVRLDGGSAGTGHVGLGLAIVAQLAQQLGATLSARHLAGGETGFAVELRWPAQPAGAAVRTASSMR